jgi:23S rRNA (adenine2503-C2)-methyltransferase
MVHLLDTIDETLRPWFQERGQGAYRVGQVRDWLFGRRAREFQEMTNLPQAVRDELAGAFTLWSAEIARHTQAPDGTEKLLLTLADGGQIECVLLRDEVRRTICISTQVGCGMGCVFCASGLDGLVRNLTTGEIVEQMLRLQQLLGPEERLSHIVVMGMGEPLANLDALLPALAEASRDDGLAISARRITISTVGLPKPMRRLADTNPRYRLAVSLHAPNDALRDQLVPLNRKYPLASLIAACNRYLEKAPRDFITFEYVMLEGVNDSEAHAREAAALARAVRCKYNLIPFNPFKGVDYKRSSPERIRRFAEILQRAGITVTTRKTRGDDIAAACGQLAGDVADRTRRGRRLQLKEVRA